MRLLTVYKESLRVAEELINAQKLTKSLKDVVGAQFEDHRRRVWKEVGGTLMTEFEYESINFDIRVKTPTGKVILEESKGHYMDSCFLERALIGTALTIRRCMDNQVEVPIFVFHSFTKYKGYYEKVQNVHAILEKPIVEYMKTNMFYTHVTDHGRSSKNEWFSASNNNGWYSYHARDDLITRDIEFMQRFF